MGFHFSTRIFFSRRKPQVIFSSFSTFAAQNPHYRKSYPYIFQECSKEKALQPGKQAHARMIVSGLKPTILDGTCLLQMYINCSRLECAAKVFDRMSEKNCVSWTTMMYGYLVSGKMGLALSLFDLMPERNVISWTSLMLGYLQNGNCLKSVGVFVIMRRDGVAYNETTFSVVFKACKILKDHVIGQQVHGVVVKLGFECQVVIGTAMLDMYAKCNNLIDARKVSNILPNPNLQSYNALIVGYARGNRGFECKQLFLQLLQSDLGFDEISLSAAFSSCAVSKGLVVGTQIHGLAIKTPFHDSIYVANAILDMYGKCGALPEAFHVFDEMKSRDVVCWSAIIAACELNKNEKTLSLFVSMLRSRVEPHECTYATVLKACADGQALQSGMEIHGRAIKCGMGTDSVISKVIVDMYCKCGMLEEAVKLHERMKKQTLFSWNAIISGYSSTEHCERALKYFSSMLEMGIKPNKATYATVLNTCSKVANVGLGKQIHAKIIKQKLQSDACIITTLVDMYCKCRMVEEAEKLHVRMEKQNLFLWNDIISGYSSIEESERAQKCFSRMLEMGIKPNRVTYATDLNACSKGANVGLGKQIHAQIIKQKLQSDACIITTLVDMYCKGRMVEEAEKLHERMKKQNLFSWNDIIFGYSSIGESERAHKCFSRMLEMGIKPNRVTYATVLSACSKVANVGLGKQIHAQIIKQKLQSDAYIITTLVDMYSKCGYMQDSVLMFQKSSKHNAVTWSTMVHAYARHRNGNEALQVFEEMLLEKVMPDHGTFVGVLRACADVGLVDEALHYLYVMKTRYGLEPELKHYSCMVDALGRSGRIIDALKFIEDMPLKAHDAIWRSLLSNCKMHGNVKVAEIAARSLLELDPQSSTAYVLLSQIYADAGMWDAALKMRTIMRNSGLKKKPGCTRIVLSSI